MDGKPAAGREPDLCGRLARNGGVVSVNIQGPAGLADGDYPLSLNVNGVSTPAGAYLTVKN